MSQSNDRKPNVLFILTDDQGPWALHAETRELQTPNLDRLGAEGLRFDRFFCASPVCSPARASILTGKIPSAHGVQDWIRSGNVDRDMVFAKNINNPYGGYTDEVKPIQYLEGQRCYTDVLAEQGYTCALSGKWHLGDSMTPQHGFSRWYTIGKGGAHYLYPDIIENGEIQIVNEYVTDLFANKALDYLAEFKDQEQPFYLSVNFTAPHSPWENGQHPEAYISLYRDSTFPEMPDVPDHPHTTTGKVHGTGRREESLRGYFAAITAMDHQVGRLLDYLDRTGLAENTVVIFMADNGMNMGHHGIWGKGNGTFPQNMYEESVRVPFIIRIPGALRPAYQKGSVCSELCSQLDFYPTLLDLLGIEDPFAAKLPGSSFCDLLTEGHAAAPRDRVVVCEEYGPVRMIRTRTQKYIHRYPFGPNEFYDLAADPHEEHNLIESEAYADTIFRLRRELFGWYQEYADPRIDSAREPVWGSGQLDRPGILATKLLAFQPNTGLSGN